MKYKANFTANNGTRLMKPRTDTNKKRITKDIRHIAEAHRFFRSRCEWYVWDENDNCLEAGGMLENGVRYRFSKEEIRERML